MVRLRWTITLIIIPIILFATVITAFRIRDLQKSSHESVSEFKKKPKCEECEVNKLDLDHKLHIYKVESIKRSYEELNKPIQEKKKITEEKTFEKIKPRFEEVDEESDEDESDENLIYLRNLASKWEEKQKSSNIENGKETLQKINKKKENIVKDNKIKNAIKLDSKKKSKNDDDDDDDDNHDYDVDVNDGINDKDSVQKTITAEFKKQSTIVSPKNDDDDNSHEDDDNDDQVNVDDNDEDVDNDYIYTKDKPKDKRIKASLSSREVETPLKHIKLSKSVVKDKLLSKEIKTSDTFKTAVKKTEEVARKLDQSIGEKEVKVKDIVIEKNNTEVESIAGEQLHKNVKLKKPNLDEVVDEKIARKKELQAPSQSDKLRTHKAIKEPTNNKQIKDHMNNEATLKEIDFEDHKNESREDSRLKHITEALHRRNLLKSEFEDFYAFLPTFAPNFTRVQNPECRRHGQILLRQLRGARLWALSMLDATAKIPSGILHGNGIQLGNFDQCLESRARVQLDTGSIVKVHGKYCLARIDLKSEHAEMEVPVHLAQAKNLIKSRIDDPGHFVPRFSTLSWGVCVPSPCNPEDVENIVRDAIKHYQYTSGVSIRVRVDAHDCHVQKKQAWWEEWLGIPILVTLSLYGVVVLLVLVATAQDFVARRKYEETTAGAKESDQKESKDKSTQVKPSEGESVISVFSLYRSVRKLVAPASADEISCIHGVRAIATLALLVAHKFLPVASMPYINRLKIAEVVSSPLWSWCRAGWMYTDCFLLLSGTLTAHRIISDNESGAFKRILFRYLRLTPALLAVILFYAYIWDNISVGPMWGSLVTKNVEVCQQGWWWNIFYVQNYFGFENMCAPQTHQLALDMQLSILAGVVVWTMQSDLPVLRAVLPTLHVWTAFSRYRTTKEHRLTLLAYHGVSVSQLYRTARLSYTSVIHRSTPYLLGLSLGLALKNNTCHSKILLAFGWLVSGTLWALVWWAGFDSGSTQYRYSATFAAQYSALAPIASALAIAWLIYAVHSGQCDFLHNLLCSRPLTLISRLSYALYLCQFVVFLTNAATVRTASEFSLISLIDVQEISLIFSSSILLTLTFVIPMQSLPKILFLVSKTIETKNEKIDPKVSEKNQRQTESSRKNEKIMEPPIIRNRQTLIAHREVLEEIPEVEIEYEQQRITNDGLEEILEEEENEEGMDEEREPIDEEELEVIEEEQGGDEDFWTNRDDNAQMRSFSRNSDDRDLDDWELTGNGNGHSGAQYYRYSRER